MIWDLIVKIAGYASLASITLASLVGAVYLLFKHLGAKWLDAKFAESLADYQHRQNQEIERLRGDIARLLDRTTRLHSQEFEVLPRAWELLGHAAGSVGACVSALKSYPNVTWLNEEELERTLDRHSKIAEFEKEEIRRLKGQKRQDKFSELLDLHAFQQAGEEWREFHNFIVTKGIFLEPIISEKFDALSDELWSVLHDYQYKAFEKSSTPTWSEIRDAWKKADDSRAGLKIAVIERLWNDINKT